MLWVVSEFVKGWTITSAIADSFYWFYQCLLQAHAVQDQVPLGEAGNDLLLVIAAHVNIHQKQICMEMPCQ